MADKTTRQPSDHATVPRASHPMGTLRDEVDRLFDSFFPPAFGRSLFGPDPWSDLWKDPAFGALGEAMPGMDVRECRDRYEIAAELPGVDERDIAVTVKDGVLSINGEMRARGAAHAYGSFTRAFQLPKDSDAEAIGARFDKGVLTVTVPKQAGAARPEKRIEIDKH